MKRSLWNVACLAFALVVLVRCGQENAKVATKPSRSDALAELVEANNVQTVEQLLELIPKALRENVVLMRKSGSSQAGSDEAPRAIVYGEDSKFIVTFNGDSEQKGYDTLEMAEFDDDSESFEFRAFVEVGNGKRMAVSDKNPEDCLGCHQSPMRPNWDSYPEWPNAFGFNQDLLIPGTTETAALKAFLARAPELPRYRKLVGLKDYMKTRAGRAKADVEGGPNDHRMVKRPNARFTEELFALNAKRVARQIHDDKPRYAEARFALAAVALRCEELEKYLPAAPGPKSFDDFMAQLPVLRSLKDVTGLGLVFQDGLRRKDFESHPNHNADVARLQVVAQAAGYDVRNWILMKRRNEPLNFRGPTRTHIDDFLRETMRRDPLLVALTPTDSTTAKQRQELCRKLDAAFQGKN